jgi:hypothetical protein
MVSRDPNRSGKRRFTGIGALAALLLVLAIAFAPWLTPLMHYR